MNKSLAGAILGAASGLLTALAFLGVEPLRQGYENRCPSYNEVKPKLPVGEPMPAEPIERGDNEPGHSERQRSAMEGHLPSPLVLDCPIPKIGDAPNAQTFLQPHT